MYLNFVKTISEYEARGFIDRKNVVGLNFIAERAVFSADLAQLESLLAVIEGKIEGCKAECFKAWRNGSVRCGS